MGKQLSDFCRKLCGIMRRGLLPSALEGVGIEHSKGPISAPNIMVEVCVSSVCNIVRKYYNKDVFKEDVGFRM